MYLGAVEARMSFVTLVVRDLAVSRRFYVEHLGWPVELEAPDEVVMVRVADKVVLSLWQEDKAVAELWARDPVRAKKLNLPGGR